LSWPVDGHTTWAHDDTHFRSALTGGFLFGSGVTIWVLSGAAAPETVRKSVLAGLVAWFFLDSAGSIASGNVSNAVLNVLVLLLAVGPLWWKAQPEVKAQPA
jgi:hypothetical protein